MIWLPAAPPCHLACHFKRGSRAKIGILDANLHARKYLQLTKHDANEHQSRNAQTWTAIHTKVMQPMALLPRPRLRLYSFWRTALRGWVGWSAALERATFTASMVTLCSEEMRLKFPLQGWPSTESGISDKQVSVLTLAACSDGLTYGGKQ